MLKSSKIIIYIVACTFLCHYFIFLSVVYAEESLGKSIDCTDVSIDYSDDPTLTREERLRLMDKAFRESLNKFEICQSAGKKAQKGGEVAGTVNGVGNGNGAEGSFSDPNGQTGGTSAGQSVATSSMSGTELPKEYPPAESIEVSEPGTSQGTQNMDEAGSKNSGKMAMSNGKSPEDIPSADNDDALAAQIRYAAEIETDPVKREQLWNEYRKYKGLAQKK